MEKYSRILIIMFFLLLFNFLCTIYIASRYNQKNIQAVETLSTPISTASPSTKAITSPPSTPFDTNNITADLKIIKAEIRAIRESLNSSGLILETPKP